jgi:hypothetical protein
LIDGTLAVRLGIDALVLVHAVLLGGRSVVDASRGLPKAKASYWRTAFRFALDEIGRSPASPPTGRSARRCRSATPCRRR